MVRKIYRWTAALIACCLLLSSAHAQTRKKKGTKKRKAHVSQNTTYHYAGSAKRNTGGKSLNDGTTGVPGRDTIRLNSKGMQRNLNTNTSSEASPGNE